MVKVLKITTSRKEEHDNYLWSITDPETPVRRAGVIARIFRRKEGKKRYTIYRKKRRSS